MSPVVSPDSAQRTVRREEPPTGVERLRRWLFAVLVLGLVGTEGELLLLEHYEEPFQLVPLMLIALALGVLGWRTRRHDAARLRTLQIVMVLCVVASFVGVVLHFRGAAEFQYEVNPSIGTWDLVKRVMRAKAPPVLAPGALLQLGLMGLVYAVSGSREQRSGVS